MKSSFSSNGANCIDVELVDGLVFVRETAAEESLGATAWENQSFYSTPKSFKAFIDGVKAGEFDHFVEGI